MRRGRVGVLGRTRWSRRRRVLSGLKRHLYIEFVYKIGVELKKRMRRYLEAAGWRRGVEVEGDERWRRNARCACFASIALRPVLMLGVDHRVALTAGAVPLDTPLRFGILPSTVQRQFVARATTLLPLFPDLYGTCVNQEWKCGVRKTHVTAITPSRNARFVRQARP